MEPTAKPPEWRVAAALFIFAGVAFYCLVVWMTYRPRTGGFQGPGTPLVYYPSVPEAALNVWYLWLAILPVFLFGVWLSLVAWKRSARDSRMGSPWKVALVLGMVPLAAVLLFLVVTLIQTDPQIGPFKCPSPPPVTFIQGC